MQPALLTYVGSRMTQPIIWELSGTQSWDFSQVAPETMMLAHLFD